MNKKKIRIFREFFPEFVEKNVLIRKIVRVLGFKKRTNHKSVLIETVLMEDPLYVECQKSTRFITHIIIWTHFGQYGLSTNNVFEIEDRYWCVNQNGC